MVTSELQISPQLNNGKVELLKNAKEFTIINGTANPQLAHDVARYLGTISHPSIRYHRDGEIDAEIPQSIRENHVFVVGSFGPPKPNDQLMELGMMSWAAKSCSAERVTAVIPYFGYARSDKQNRGRVPKGVDVAKSFLKGCGVDDFITVDIHAEQSQGGDYPTPWDNLYGTYHLVPAIRNLDLDNLVVVAPDSGARPRASAFNKLLEIDDDVRVATKRRNPKDRDDVIYNLEGSFDGRNILIVDDLIDTGGTICNVADMLKERGAERIFAAATHGVLSEDERISAYDNIFYSQIETLFLLNTIKPTDKALGLYPRIKILSGAPLIAQAIMRKVVRGKSMSELFTSLSSPEDQRFLTVSTTL